MTDETTARDRAIERAYTVALGEITSAAISTPADTLAMRVVFALLAYPEVLRALAGAPTADVAAPPHSDPCSTCGGYGIVHDPGYYVPGEQFVEPPSDERCEDCVGTGMREVQERIRSAAPEGVDAADEPHAIRIRPAYEADGSMYDEPCTRRAGCGSGTHQLSCPEPDEPDGMDLEAEGEMADQLDAAQAAIQRVREVATEYERGTIYGRNQALVQVAARIRRALDGEIKPHYPEAFEGGQRLCPEGRGDCECLDVEGR